MEKINYPLIGLVVVEADHEENYIFTEAEFERVSFPRARKIILSDELKLTGFIHGRYNARNKAENQPDWYWTNISAYPPARSNTFNKVVDALDLCRMNVFYTHNRSELPFTRIATKNGLAPAELAWWDELFHSPVEEIMEKSGLKFGYEKSFSIDVENETINIRFQVKHNPEALITLTRKDDEKIDVIRLERDPLSEMMGEWRLYEWSSNKEQFVSGYSIAVEKE